MSSDAETLYNLINKQDIVQKEFVDLLSKGKANGQNVNGKLWNGQSLLFHLSKRDFFNHIEAIIDSGIDIDVNESNQYQIAPLHLAKSDKCIELLLRAGAVVNARDVDGNTPLHRFCSKENLCFQSVSGVRMLLEAGADVEAVNDNARTPLHYGHTLSTVRQLIEYGADVHAIDNYAQTPLYAFLRRNNWPKDAAAVVKTFIAASAHVHRTHVRGFDEIPLVIGRWGISTKRDETSVMEPILTQFLLAGASFDGEFMYGSAKKTVWQLAHCVECVRFLLTVGVELKRTDFECLQSKNNANLLLSSTVMYPKAIEWIDNDALKVFVSDEKNIEEETKKLNEVEERWKENVYQSCTKRVIELTMVFVEYPTLIVYEICCFEQKYLAVVERFKVWQLIDSVRKCLKK